MIDYSNYRSIQVRRAGKKLTLTLNRPDVLNAINAELHEELGRIFQDVAADPEADVIIITGAGKAFCAGGDIPWMQQLIDEPGAFEKTIVEAKKLIFGMLDCEKPIIARVPGDAIGLGATIALFSDIIIAADSARFGDPHVRVGFVAGDGGAVIWPQLIGYARAKELLMTGDLVSAPDAARMGLINHAVPEAELDQKVDALADKLARGATKAIRWTKIAVNIPLKKLATEILDCSLAFEALSNQTADHKEAVAAFREKRRPQFVGR